MTVRQYARYESEHNLKLLFRRFNWLPVRWFTKQIEAFTTEFNRLFSPEQAGEIYRTVNKMLFQNKLLIMQALSEALYVHLVRKAELDILKSKCKIKIEPDNNLIEYIERIKELTGIEIKTLEDVAEFRSELERSIDKFGEMFPDKPAVKSAGIMELFYIYCTVLEITPSHVDMTLTEFAEFKKQAEERSKRIQEQINKK
jgi:hypothetical protein